MLQRRIIEEINRERKEVKKITEEGRDTTYLAIGSLDRCTSEEWLAHSAS